MLLTVRRRVSFSVMWDVTNVFSQSSFVMCKGLHCLHEPSPTPGYQKAGCSVHKLLYETVAGRLDPGYFIVYIPPFCSNFFTFTTWPCIVYREAGFVQLLTFVHKRCFSQSIFERLLVLTCCVIFVIFSFTECDPRGGREVCRLAVHLEESL